MVGGTWQAVPVGRREGGTGEAVPGGKREGRIRTCAKPASYPYMYGLYYTYIYVRILQRIDVVFGT